MKNEWILDVLVDLINYAKTNGMPVLAMQLEAAAVQAMTELASNQHSEVL
ncbi:hypothetical protein [uncultured Roseobacter sp.]|nr:hypothetical protein [uncultured Roseobacter sp.]